MARGLMFIVKGIMIYMLFVNHALINRDYDNVVILVAVALSTILIIIGLIAEADDYDYIVDQLHKIKQYVQQCRCKNND